MKTGKWTAETALARAKSKGCEVNTEKKQVFVKPEPGVGNGTLGALDYLKNHAKYSVIFKE